MVDTKKTRGRPRKLCPDQAAQIAMKLFWQKGYDAVGIADLTEAMGIKSPSLYAAFGSKANVFAAALTAYDGLVSPHFAPAFAEQTAKGFATRLLEIAADIYTSHPEHLGCLVLDGARNSDDPDATAHAAGHRRAFTSAIARRLADLGAENSAQMADHMTVAMFGLSGAARSGVPADAIKQSAKSFTVTL